MIIPYSTDAPIYYFPWTTILVVITNAVVFVLTGYGHHPGHWFLEFGNGLHPLQWFTFSFVHRHWLPLLETMFFFWTFGIVVEGKLGWWKFLSLYFGINLVCGMFVQTVMLGYGTVDEVALRSNDQTIWSVFDPPSAWAQDDDVDDVGVDDEVMNADEDAPDDAEPNGPAPNLIPNRRGGDNDELTDEDKQFLEDLEQDGKPGIGGAMFIVFAMLGIILVWAPKNEVSCLFLFGRFGGTVELEFLFFCGLKIFFEIMNCCFMLMLSALIPGLYAATEVANLFSVCFGFAIGTISVRKGWVDCENWDLFAYMQNKHGNLQDVGQWQQYALSADRSVKGIATPQLGNDGDADWEGPKSKKPKSKSKPKPKLVALETLDDDFDDPIEPEKPSDDLDEVFDDVEVVEDDFDDLPSLPAKGSTSTRKKNVPVAAPLPSQNKERETKGLDVDRNIRTNPSPSRRSPTAKSSASQSNPVPSDRSSTRKVDVDSGSDSTFGFEIDVIRQAIQEGRIDEALEEIRRTQDRDSTFQLSQVDLANLAEVCVKLEKIPEARQAFEEYIQRFSDNADRQRLKLAVIYVKYMKRPTAALKLIVKIDKEKLPEKYHSVHQQAARLAQKMISEGVTDER